MASYHYNIYPKYTAAYRVVKLQAKDKPFSYLPLTPGAFIEGTFILQALVYSQDIAAIPSVTAKTIIVHLSSLPFYVIRKSPEGLMRFNVIFSRYHYIWDTCVFHLMKISP